MTPKLPVGVRIRATLAAAVVPPLLRCMSFARLASWLDRGDDNRVDGHVAEFDDATVAHLVDGLLRRWPGPWRHTCLKRAAVLYYVLRRAGRPVELWIGVRRDVARPAGIGAHAWLMRNGAPYLEPTEHSWSHHTPIARFPDVQHAR